MKHYDADLFAKRLKQAIKAAGMTVDEFATHTEISLSHVRSLSTANVARTYGPSAEMLMQISQVLGVTINWLLGVES